MNNGELEARIVRYRDLRPCYNAFIDTRTPGSEAKENFTIIGPGVSENPAQHVHIAEPHGFNIGGARQPPNCVNSQHSHDTAEVFVVHTGRWRFDFGENADDSSVEAGPGDIVSFPTRVFRGFTNIGADGESGFLWAVLGGDDPGRVTWAPKVFEMARDYGLVLMENGSLIDTAAGEAMPDHIAPMAPTTPEQVAALHRVTVEEARGLIVRDADRAPANGAVTITPLIGPDAPMSWSHGFRVERRDLTAGAEVSSHSHDVPEVLFVHAGTLNIDVDGDSATLEAGDTLTVPIGAARSYSAPATATLFIVRGE